MKKFLFLVLCLMFLAGIMAVPQNNVYANEVNQGSAAEEAYDVPIIMYHSTYKNTSGKHTITPNMLEKDLVYLKEQGYTTIGINDIIEYQEKGTALPKKPVVLTFDDGYHNNYNNAFPLLKKHNMKAVFSVVGRLIDENYDKEGKLIPSGAHVSYEQIKEMAESGLVEIQNHTYNMHNLKGGRVSMKKLKSESPEDYEKAISADLLKLENNLKDKLGISCSAVTFPFGAYSEQTFDIVKKLGFKAALTCNAGVNKITRESDLFHLKRYNRPSSPDSSVYFAKYHI